MKAKLLSKAHVLIYRAVAGAVVNAAHGHPKWKLTPVIANSIAKRAIGTLTANWPKVLAVRTEPSNGDELVVAATHPKSTTPRLGWPVRRASHAIRRSPLTRLWKQVSFLTGEAKRSGQSERAEAYIEVLRRISALQKESSHVKCGVICRPLPSEAPEETAGDNHQGH